MGVFLVFWRVKDSLCIKYILYGGENKAKKGYFGKRLLKLLL